MCVHGLIPRYMVMQVLVETYTGRHITQLQSVGDLTGKLLAYYNNQCQIQSLNTCVVPCVSLYHMSQTEMHFMIWTLLFVGFRDPEIKCVHVPDMEIQQIAKRTLAARLDRMNMDRYVSIMFH